MADTNEPFWGRTDDDTFVQLQWDLAWTTVKSNDSGKTGWARVLRSCGGVLRSCGGDVVPEGACRRFHKCAHNPCSARWSASKYGVYGPPIHVQEVAENDVPLGPAPPTSASLHANYIPPPHPFDPQWRASAQMQWLLNPAVAEQSHSGGAIDVSSHSDIGSPDGDSESIRGLHILRSCRVDEKVSPIDVGGRQPDRFVGVVCPMGMRGLHSRLCRARGCVLS